MAPHLLTISGTKPMEDWVALFKSNPLAAIGMVLLGGGAWLLKNRQEKSVDNREVTRLTTALDLKTKEADEANERADAAFAKQLELTERFSQMSAQNARLEERMEQVSNQLKNMADDNASLRDQVKALSDQNKELSSQVKRLQSTIDSGAA